jgi:hypothetical protein
MTQAGIWAVDEVEARNLLAELGLAESEGRLAVAARHFARHRLAMASWAAERAQQEIVQSLETASGETFARENGDWINGYNHAESLVCGLDVASLIDCRPGRPLTKGRLLRFMIRQARGR